MPRLRCAPHLALLAASLAPQLAHAVRRSTGDDAVLRSKAGVMVQRERAVQWRAASVGTVAREVAALRRDLGRTWIAWDDVTGSPHRMLLEGVDAPGVMASASAAAAFAEGVLARHVALLAPGSAASDFVLVANDLSADIRSVGFVQHHRGVPVHGGQISFRFKNDRLVVVANDALPNVAVDLRPADPVAATSRARAWITADIAGKSHVASARGGTIILPIFERGAVAYREVVRVDVEVEAPASKWAIYVDTRTGEPIARRQELLHEIAGVVYRVPVRSPQDPRADFAAPFVDVVVDGAGTTTDGGGVFEFAGPGQSLNSPVGPFVQVFNASGDLATQSFTAQPGSGAVWNPEGDEVVDAQLNAFIHTSRVKSHVRAIDPSLAWLDSQIAVTVNIDDECNAFSDGDSINFYRASDNCENTGLLADVVHHEFGHSVHHQSLIDGVGFFDTALSEGISDYLSMTLADDSGVARGFFFDDTPLRELDPPDYEYRWPEDNGAVHDAGRIIGGALWDLRKLLVAKYGPAGVTVTDRIWYESTRRAVDIPSMYVEALVVDDDDGNLANGTPNACEINAAYGPHGLFTAGENAEIVTATNEADGVRVDLQVALPSFPGCPIDASPDILWRPREAPENENGRSMEGGGGAWTAKIPAPAEGTVLQYQVEVNYSSGAERSLPDNFADPWYETYWGSVIPLYCTGFGDGAPDWSTVGDWDVDVPQGNSGNRDPSASHDADGVVLGNVLSSDGLYFPGSDLVAHAPSIATSGYSNVRLQYRRWLTVEDGFFDRAEIVADGSRVWANYASEVDLVATAHHVDREWRFHDIDLSQFVSDGFVQLDFGLVSDGGLEFGGWNIDEFCVVAAGVPTTCGNGLLDVGESCDDGNVAAGDGCDPACLVEPGGSTTPSTGGNDTGDEDPTDDSSSSGDDGGLEESGLLGRGCRCDANGRTGRAGWFVLLAGAITLRRRRRS